jgi:outer membrane protein assembly factor BamB
MLPLLLLTLCSPHVFAQNEENTDYLWRQALNGAVIGRPTVQAQSVLIALDGGNIRAYSASGRFLWNFSVPGRLSPYITRSREGTSYICRTNGIFFAINRAGRELWRVNIGGTLSGPPVIGWDGRVFIPAAKKIFCYTASGNLLWVRELNDTICASPCLDMNGGILLALENGDIIRINPYGAAEVKRLLSPSSGGEPPRILLSVKRLITPNDDSATPLIMALYRNGDIQLIDLSQPDTEPANLPRLPSPPLAAASRGENAAAVLGNGQMVMLSCADGTILWTGDTHIVVQGGLPSGGGGRGAPLQSEGAENDATVLFDERGVYALTASGATGFTIDGRRLWYTTLTNASSIPAFDDDGILYSGGKDWILYAWKLENRALKKNQSVYGPAPEGSYGMMPLPSSAFYTDDQTQQQLTDMRREILAGRVGENEGEWLAYLMGIAGGTLRQGVILFAHPKAQLSHRILALQLLARIGSVETVPWLARLFRLEDEPLIKVAAAQAIGGIGIDPNGIAIQEFLSVANGTRPVHDEQVLVSVAAATGALCRFSGPPLSDTGSRILVLLSSINRPPSVQRQALRELREMGGIIPNS